MKADPSRRELGTLNMRPQRSLLPVSTLSEHSKMTLYEPGSGPAVYEPGCGPSLDTKCTSDLILDFPISRTVRNVLFFLIRHSIYDILLQQPKYSKQYSLHTCASMYILTLFIYNLYTFTNYHYLYTLYYYLYAFTLFIDNYL